MQHSAFGQTKDERCMQRGTALGENVRDVKIMEAGAVAGELIWAVTQHCRWHERAVGEAMAKAVIRGLMLKQQLPFLPAAFGCGWRPVDPNERQPRGLPEAPQHHSSAQQVPQGLQGNSVGPEKAAAQDEENTEEVQAKLQRAQEWKRKAKKPAWATAAREWRRNAEETIRSRAAFIQLRFCCVSPRLARLW